MQCSEPYVCVRKSRPVQRQSVIYLGDIQQAAPAGWCTACGQELYAPDRELCRRCERKDIYYETTNKSL